MKLIDLWKATNEIKEKNQQEDLNKNIEAQKTTAA